jgi:hypothetical protein
VLYQSFNFLFKKVNLNKDPDRAENPATIAPIKAVRKIK